MNIGTWTFKLKLKCKLGFIHFDRWQKFFVYRINNPFLITLRGSNFLLSHNYHNLSLTTYHSSNFSCICMLVVDLIWYILLCSVAGILVGVVYMVLLYGLYVPDWNFDASNVSMTLPPLLKDNSETVSWSADSCGAFQWERYLIYLSKSIKMAFVMTCLYL